MYQTKKVFAKFAMEPKIAQNTKFWIPGDGDVDVDKRT